MVEEIRGSTSPSLVETLTSQLINRAMFRCKATSTFHHLRIMEVKDNNNNNNNNSSSLEVVMDNRFSINISGHLTLLQCLIMLNFRTCLKMLMILIHMSLVSTIVRILEVVCLGGVSRHKDRMQDSKALKILVGAFISRCVGVEIQLVEVLARVDLVE